MHTKDTIWKTFKKDQCNKDFWEMVNESNIAHIFYVHKNNLTVWEQAWKYPADNTGTSQAD